MILLAVIASVQGAPYHFPRGSSHRLYIRFSAFPVLSTWQQLLELPQPKLSVTRSIGVPVGQGHHPTLEPWPFDDEFGQ